MLGITRSKTPYRLSDEFDDLGSTWNKKTQPRLSFFVGITNQVLFHVERN